MGAGYYDRYLPKLRPETPVWAVAYEIQKVTLISADPWDIPMNRIITESTVYFNTVSKEGISMHPFGRLLMPL